jgi:thiamine pyrophosphate-dependent acetolactate synthase large subunit-like protein
MLNPPSPQRAITEEGAALAAAGQAKLTGHLSVCAGTTGPGSTHLVAGLYEAARDHAPVLALSGDMPRKMHGIDYIQATEPDLLFRDVSLYTETISSPEQAPSVIHQAIAAAYAEAKFPCYLGKYREFSSSRLAKPENSRK